MACSQYSLEFLELDFEPPLVDEAGPREDSGRTTISLQQASWTKLFSMEAPLMAVLLMVLSIAVLITPESASRLGFINISYPSLIVCPLFEVTGLPCLFCGMTRSFLAMGGLDVGQAFIFHPLGPVFFLLSIAAALGLAFSLAFRKRIGISPSRGLQTSLIWISVTGILLAWPLKLYIWHKTGLI